MVIEVYMIKVIFIKTKVIFTKINEDFKLALSWIITENLFVMKDYFLEVYFSMDVFYPTCPHKNLIICLSLIC